MGRSVVLAVFLNCPFPFVFGRYDPPIPGGPPKPYLADDDSQNVPHDVMSKGSAIIDTLGEIVKSAFPASDASIPKASDGEYARIMSAEVFDFESIEHKLDHTLFPTVAAFVDASVIAWKKNPILIELAAEWSDLPPDRRAASYPAASPEREADIRSAVVLAYVETVVAHAAMTEPKMASGGILAEIVQSFEDRRKNMTRNGEPVWAKFSDAFEELKRVSVDAAVATMLEYKKDTVRSANLFREGMRDLVTFDGLKPRVHAEVNSGILLSLNMLEAMYEDVRRVWQAENSKTVPVTAPVCGQDGAPPQNLPDRCVCFGGDPNTNTQCGPPSSGSHDNAEAGIALVLHASKVLIPGTNKHRQCGSGSNSGQACDGLLWNVPSKAAALPRHVSAEYITGNGTATGSIKLSSQFPKAWNNLYNSWNGAFVSGYVDSPVFYTKLFNPLVAGFYHSDDATMYMWPRALTLYMIVQYMNVLERVRLQRNMVTNVQWNRGVITELWGKVNNKAATEYRTRIQKAWDESEVGWKFNPIYDGIKKLMVEKTEATLSLMVFSWHQLAGKISNGFTLSNSFVSTLVSIASGLTGLDSMVGGYEPQQEKSDTMNPPKLVV